MDNEKRKNPAAASKGLAPGGAYEERFPSGQSATETISNTGTVKLARAGAMQREEHLPEGVQALCRKWVPYQDGQVAEAPSMLRYVRDAHSKRQTGVDDRFKGSRPDELGSNTGGSTSGVGASPGWAVLQSEATVASLEHVATHAGKRKQQATRKPQHM